MCLAIPGRIIEIKESNAIVEYYTSERVNAKIVEGSYREGDYVIVQAKLVIEKVPKKEAITWLNALKENES